MSLPRNNNNGQLFLKGKFNINIYYTVYTLYNTTSLNLFFKATFIMCQNKSVNITSFLLSITESSMTCIVCCEANNCIFIIILCFSSDQEGKIELIKLAYHRHLLSKCLFASFYDISIIFRKCSDSVIFNVCHYIITICLRPSVLTTIVLR